MVEVYKTPIKYDEKFDTKIEKQDFISGLMTYGIRRTFYGAATGTTTELYKIPAGKVFFVVTMNLFGRTDGAGTGNCWIEDNNNKEILTLLLRQINLKEVTSIALAIPLKFNPSESLSVQSDSASCQGYASITGYEVDASLVPLFT